jgi:hypothetical protein
LERKSVFFQHKILPLVVVLYVDNNNVTTLSNYHSPEVCAKGNGALQRRKVNRKREHKKTEVRCSRQNRDYSAKFHWIDKGYGKEAIYDLNGVKQGTQLVSKVSSPFDEYAQLKCVDMISATTSTPHLGLSITQLK